MTNPRTKIGVKVLLLFSVVGVLLCTNASTTHAQVYTPPTQITVEMFAVDPSTGRKTTASSGNAQRCMVGDQRYGCTAFPSNADLNYPFDTNPVTVQIEGTATNNRYLRDVLPGEVIISAIHPTALLAQAIAARSYAFYHIHYTGQVNNTADFQMFLPRLYDGLSLTYKVKVGTSLQTLQYVSPQSTNLPAFTEFFPDRANTTLDGNTSNLRAVADPISSHPLVTDSGHGHGLSQNGASRWARGNLSYNIDSDLGGWSTTWNNHLQILTHYYTAVHVRNTSNTTAVTPANRWVPLTVRFDAQNPAPITTCAGLHRISVWLQNTSAGDWSASAFSLVVLGNGQQLGSASIPVSVTSGTGTHSTYVTANLSGNNTTYDLSLDMKAGNQLFSAQSPSWPSYALPTITVVQCPQTAYLPLVQGTSVSQ